MNILIKSATLYDKRSPYHGQKKSVRLENGIIQQIGDKLQGGDTVLEGEHLGLSPGWFDMRTTMGEPGLEYKEDLQSLSRAAARGGFTEIACLPNTKPPVQTRDAVAYIKTTTQNNLVAVHPMASVTLNNKGEELTEMIDLHLAGAVAFTDGDRPIWHTDVMLKALQYVQYFNGLVINHAEDKHLTHGAQMNESPESTRLGLKGFPKLAEELMIARDLQILEYTGGRVHFAHVSSPKSLDLIRQAKKKGLAVTCDIAGYQLALDEHSLRGFDTNLKVNPPLRPTDDLVYFWKAIEDDTIDVIVSDHIPQDTESKKLEFDQAEFGMIGLESLFGLINKHRGKVDLEKIIDKISLAPRKILNLPLPSLEVGAPANLTLFDEKISWTFETASIASKSNNSPLLGETLVGKPLAVIRQGKIIM